MISLFYIHDLVGSHNCLLHVCFLVMGLVLLALGLRYVDLLLEDILLDRVVVILLRVGRILGALRGPWSTGISSRTGSLFKESSALGFVAVLTFVGLNGVGIRDVVLVWQLVQIEIILRR